MAVLLGSSTLVADASSLRNPPTSLDYKSRHTSTDHLLVNLPHRVREILLANTGNSSSAVSPSIHIKTREFEADCGSSRAANRRGHKSKASAFEFDAINGSGDENGDMDDGGNGGDDLEKKMRRRLREIEEMKELERKAEELQSRAEGGRGVEETEEEKKQRVRRELEKLAKEQAEQRETAKLMFELGQKAYGKGMYGRAIEFLEGALTIIPSPTLFGGEIQIWLAMAYDANKRHKDCIALYLQLEKKHPVPSIRRQAADLRYILQAPKLKISQDEMVTIPLIGSSYDSYAGTWTDKYKDRDQNRSGLVTTNQLASSRDYLSDFLVWRPPKDWEKSREFWLMLTFWAGLVGAALLLQR